MKNNQLIKDLILSIVIAVLFSSFIYLEDFGFSIKILNTITTLAALYLLLHTSKRTILLAGFFIGIFWFYWISYSFKYNGIGYIAPFVVVGFGTIYSLFFGSLALTNQAYIRALLLFGLSFFAPMDFNWMQVNLGITDSYIGIYKWQFP